MGNLLKVVLASQNTIKTMKHFLFLAMSFFSVSASAQQGLEGIIVETYYISNTADEVPNDGGTLPSESVTYRVFVDMLPDYKFQAAYGTPSIGGEGGHELSISTSTLFFNNEDRGATTPTYTKNQARDNTVMLDSWLSVGAACVGQMGVLKTEDDGVATNQNNDNLLQNNNPAAGIPLTEQDGMITGVPVNATLVGEANLASPIFDNTNEVSNGSSFVMNDGAWSALTGATGPTASNRVLIGQFTTNGVFSFKLNIQIGTPAGGVERYVAENPVNDEIQFAGLMFTSDVITVAKYIKSEEPLFSISPNPSADRFNVILNHDLNAVKLRIVDMQGRLIEQRYFNGLTSNQSNEFSVDHLPSGTYLVQVVADGKQSTLRFVKP